jgi:flagellar hook-associated protein 2
MGTSANSQISYLASTTKTRPSGPAGYAVVITQAATKHTLLGEVAQVDPLLEQEILTFNGALFGNTSYDLILDAGMTQAQIVEKINGDAKLKDLVTATVSGGKLQIESKKFGTPGIMTVSSNRAGLPFSSGIGTPTVSVQGVNVEGTINGETATGSGQMLTGATGNANTEGLQLLYTGSATGSVGTLNFTKGIAAIFGDLVATFNDATNGLLSATDTSLTTQIDGLTTSINDLQARLTTKSQMLRLKFTKMEEAIARLQGQQQRLASIRTR